MARVNVCPLDTDVGGTVSAAATCLVIGCGSYGKTQLDCSRYLCGVHPLSGSVCDIRSHSGWSLKSVRAYEAPLMS